MKLEKNKVYTFKLTSGEELIAKVKEIHDNEITISDPLSVAPGPQGMGLVPSMFTVDPKTEIRINKSSITVYGLTDEPVSQKYIEATGNIIVPQKKLILG